MKAEVAMQLLDILWTRNIPWLRKNAGFVVKAVSKSGGRKKGFVAHLLSANRTVERNEGFVVQSCPQIPQSLKNALDIWTSSYFIIIICVRCNDHSTHLSNATQRKLPQLSLSTVSLDMTRPPMLHNGTGTTRYRHCKTTDGFITVMPWRRMDLFETNNERVFNRIMCGNYKAWCWWRKSEEETLSSVKYG